MKISISTDRWKYRIRVLGLCATCFSIGMVVASELPKWSVMILVVVWLVWFMAYDEYAFSKIQKKSSHQPGSYED